MLTIGHMPEAVFAVIRRKRRQPLCLGMLISGNMVFAAINTPHGLDPCLEAP